MRGSRRCDSDHIWFLGWLTRHEAPPVIRHLELSRRGAHRFVTGDSVAPKKKRGEVIPAARNNTRDLYEN